MRNPTLTAELVAERVAALDAIERDPEHWTEACNRWRAHGREWLILRGADGAVDYDINAGEQLSMAVRWEDPTPWTVRVPVAVVRSNRPKMPEPPSADHPWALREDWPAREGNTRVVTAADLMASPNDRPLNLHVELIEGRPTDA